MNKIEDVIAVAMARDYRLSLHHQKENDARH